MKQFLLIYIHHANTAIEHTHFPMLTVDELIVKLRIATRFSKLDLNKTFHQLELDPESHYITAFQTKDHIKDRNNFYWGLIVPLKSCNMLYKPC